MNTIYFTKIMKERSIIQYNRYKYDVGVITERSKINKVWILEDGYKQFFRGFVQQPWYIEKGCNTTGIQFLSIGFSFTSMTMSSITSDIEFGKSWEDDEYRTFMEKTKIFVKWCNALQPNSDFV